MHAKHRNGPGYMYRSNNMGIGGVAAASRVSPEGSMRGQRMYNTDYHRDGYGRDGRSKQFQMLPPPQEADIFMEAGRLAAEYLVSKGVLPPNALSGKWQNDGLKNQVGNFRGFRQHEVERTQAPSNGRASAHSRLGNAAIEVGQGRRRYSDEYNSMGSRGSLRGRKRTGSFRSYGPEANRELGRSGSWAEKSWASPGMEGDCDTSVGHQTEQDRGKDNNGGIPLSSPFDGAQEGDIEASVESGKGKCNEADVSDANNSTLSNKKSLPIDTDGEVVKRCDGADKLDDGAEVEKGERNDNDLQQKRDKHKDSEVEKSEINDNDSEQKHDKNEDEVIPMTENTLVSEDHVDLVKHCKFVNVPTKARSSLATRVSKVHLESKKEDEDISKGECSGGFGTHAMDGNIVTCVSASSHQNHELKFLQSDVLNALAMKKEPDVTHGMGPGECLRSGSFSEISQHKEHKQEELSGFQTSDSTISERDQKRVIDFDDDGREDVKRIRQWVVPADIQSDDLKPLSTSTENQPTAQQPVASQSAHVTLSPDQESLDISLFPKGHAAPCEFMEEKQLFPSSFKTCDLNLVGTSCDGNENNSADSMLVFPSVTQAGKVGTSIGMDLSMSNNHSLPNRNGKHGIKDNHIEVIDLENDSLLEHKAFSDPEKRGDAMFGDLDGFSNNVHNANGIPDVHDGYGFMISELLANGSPNCSSVSTDLNSLHNHMGIPNTEGMLGDDDSIYMSLEEIPISILGPPWEQPPQDYGKPF